MRIGYLSSRIIVIVNVVGILLCLTTSVWIYLTHSDLTPEKPERVFQKNIKEANKIRNLDKDRFIGHDLYPSGKSGFDMNCDK